MIVCAMWDHPTAANLQEKACGALRNLAVSGIYNQLPELWIVSEINEFLFQQCPTERR